MVACFMLCLRSPTQPFRVAVKTMRCSNLVSSDSVSITFSVDAPARRQYVSNAIHKSSTASLRTLRLWCRVLRKSRRKPKWKRAFPTRFSAKFNSVLVGFSQVHFNERCRRKCGQCVASVAEPSLVIVLVDRCCCRVFLLDAWITLSPVHWEHSSRL